MKRNSFIIANLQNINIRASTQSVNLSVCFGSSTLWIVVRDVGARAYSNSVVTVIHLCIYDRLDQITLDYLPHIKPNTDHKPGRHFHLSGTRRAMNSYQISTPLSEATVASASNITELEPGDDALLSTCICEYRYRVKSSNIFF
ncbi:hypothetical protein DPX16_21698 [Anabarilius grahami]|uniref:Uncharacterized protein n=1 Tax=Anabarilius grahami TaxID=495550 RepID=A0A3N0YK52_ANAGA|nr:hypothetical protein DPX16_21698 [Anabarilius grahami]